jgi:protein SCO1/2
MDRRSYLAGLGTAGLAGTAGCLGGLGQLAGGNPDVVLPEPDRQYDSEDVPYAAWGQQLPTVTLPGALSGGEVTLGERPTPYFVTYFFANCMTLCPILESLLREVQIHGVQNGYAGEVSFFPITFDPERDTPERLRQEAEEMSVDLEAGNWDYLRPASRERAKQVITDELGITFRRTPGPDGDEENYMYVHPGVVQLVNADGVVERAYRISMSEPVDESRVVDDLDRVRQAGGAP